MLEGWKALLEAADAGLVPRMRVPSPPETPGATVTDSDYDSNDID